MNMIQSAVQAACFFKEHSPPKYQELAERVGEFIEKGFLFCTRDGDGDPVAYAVAFPVRAEDVQDEADLQPEDASPFGDVLWGYYAVCDWRIRGNRKVWTLLFPMLQAAAAAFPNTKKLAYVRGFRDDFRVRVKEGKDGR